MAFILNIICLKQGLTGFSMSVLTGIADFLA
jgi:hypothetical protein